MVKCEKCNQEIIEQKTIKIKELNIEIEKEIHNKGEILADIKIPKGWRLLKYSEIAFLYENEKYRHELSLDSAWEFIEQCNSKEKEKGTVARFYSGSDGAGLYCGGNPGDSDRALGVRFCREIEE